MRGRDRISDLPDSILHHIFSFLNIGHAVHASILSKRWRNFWKSLSYLDFIDDHRPNVDFVDRVNKVLILREKLDVLRFRVDSEDRAVARHIYSWILAAIQSNVREIDLNVVARCKLPGYLFSCKTLTVLKVAFDHCEHKLPLPSSGPPNLKVLHLKACRLPSAEVTSKFISGCFSLEHLELDYIELESGKKYLISNAKLESLVIRNPYIFADDSNCKFEICAANLKAFTCLVVMETEILFEPLPLLNSADIDIEIEDFGLRPWSASDLAEDDKRVYLRQVARLLDVVRNVESLILSVRVFEVAFEPCAVSKCQSLQFRNLKYLNLSTCLSGACVFTIIELLRMSPKIETMVLHIIENGGKPLNWDEGMISSAKVGEGQWLLEQCTFPNLKVFEINRVIGCMNELKLLETVLKSATALEKIVIWTLCGIIGMKSDTKDGRINFGKILTTIPQASSNVLILFF